MRRKAGTVNLRQRAREIIVECGVPLAPGGQFPEALDSLIYAVAKDDALSDARHETIMRISDQKLRMDVDQHFGSLMITYEEAGYFVGLMIGLELATQIRGAR